MIAQTLADFAAAVNGTDRPVFVHYLTMESAWWHFGDCFPDMDTCVIPNGGDLDAQEN